MPLSEYEKHVLDELEAQLASDDPKLAMSLIQTPAEGRRSRVAVGIFLGLLGLAVLLGGMVWGIIWLSLLGFALMFAAAWLPIAAFGRPARKAGAPAAPKPGKVSPGIGHRLEERWNRRQGR